MSKDWEELLIKVRNGVAALHNRIEFLEKRVETLEKENAELKGNIRILEKDVDDAYNNH